MKIDYWLENHLTNKYALSIEICRVQQGDSGQPEPLV
jgi:hypothetical protein